jgi:23S rRNA pseudouridine2605 synthase
MRPRKHAPRPRPERTPPPAAGGGQRLQKVLAAAGIASRRECEQWILAGRVDVDRKVVTELGTRVDPHTQEIRVDGTPLRRPRRVYFMLHKPPGVVCTNRDPSGRPRAVDLIKSDERLFTIGRLDLASEGLIIATNDGDLANQLTHPRYGVAKTYAVCVAGNPTADDLNQLRTGIRLAEAFVQVGSLEVKRRHKQSTDVEIVLNEGRNREIRRILARIGHKVLRLKRIAVGSVRLGDLPVGAHRKLTSEEIRKLEADADPRARKGKPRRAQRPAGPVASQGPPGPTPSRPSARPAASRRPAGPAASRRPAGPAASRRPAGPRSSRGPAGAPRPERRSRGPNGPRPAPARGSILPYEAPDEGPRESSPPPSDEPQ